MSVAIAAFAGAAILLVALLLLGKLRLGPEEGDRARRIAAGPQRSPGDPVRPGACPLCATELGPGERIKSDILPGEGPRLMRIFGCPHCLAGQTGRSCPVCGRDIPTASWAVARYFERPGRRHVHILGCDACRPGGAGGRS